MSMELRTQALDRILEALSPALVAELERVVSEPGETLEQDFGKRLQAAVREAETATQNAADIQLQRALTETRESVRKQVSEELEQKFKKAIEATTNQLKSEWATERTRLVEQLEQWRIFAESHRQLAEASSQAEILARFLKLAESFAASLAVYVSKSDGLALWKSRGKTTFPEIISKETTDPEFYFRTIIVRDKTVAAVCAAQPCKADALEFLAATMERAIEIFGLKLRAPVPKANVAAEAAAGSAATAPSQGSADADDPRLHSEARRTARPLISEIKLYHEQEVKEGRERSDLYQRLQKESDEGRAAYKQRVPAAVLASHDYYHEELVRILGENDPSRLGTAYPGPITS